MNLKARLKQLEGRQTTHKVTIWAVIFGEASPDELDDESRAQYEFLTGPPPDDEYDPIEARIQAVGGSI
jgi:hypothetical protein